MTTPPTLGHHTEMIVANLTVIDGNFNSDSAHQAVPCLRDWLVKFERGAQTEGPILT